MLKVIAVLTASAIGAGLVMAPPSRSSTSSAAERAAPCSIDSLGKAQAIDTLRLQRRTTDLAVGESTEGGLITLFSEGTRPRVLFILYAGEMGREVFRYFLVSSTQYVMQYEQVRYEMPLRENPNARPISVLTSTRYVCDGAVLQVPTDAEWIQADAKLRAMLEKLGVGP